LNTAHESQQNQWGGFAIKYGILPLNPTLLLSKLTHGAIGYKAPIELANPGSRTGQLP
jgi:hypothetical protein